MSTKITPFGRYLRIFRIDTGETQKQMAQKLNVTAAYLSAIEIGERPIPDYFCKAIADAYHLDEKQKTEIAEAAWQTKDHQKIKLISVFNILMDLTQRAIEKQAQDDTERAYKKGYTDALASFKNKLMNGE